MTRNVLSLISCSKVRNNETTFKIVVNPGPTAPGETVDAADNAHVVSCLKSWRKSYACDRGITIPRDHVRKINRQRMRKGMPQSHNQRGRTCLADVRKALNSRMSRAGCFGASDFLRGNDNRRRDQSPSHNVGPLCGKGGDSTALGLLGV